MKFAFKFDTQTTIMESDSKKGLQNQNNIDEESVQRQAHHPVYQPYTRQNSKHKVHVTSKASLNVGSNHIASVTEIVQQ